MKITKITIIFLMACLTLGIQDRRQVIANSKPIVETKAISTTKLIPFSFPTKATVVLKDGDSRSGKLTDINSQNITIKRGQKIAQEAIANIDWIEFNGDIWWPASSKYTKFRGLEIETKYKPRNFQLRMDGLEWEDAENGVANVKPEAVVGVDEREGLPRSINTSNKSRYIVSKVKFEPDQQILIITATSQSRTE
ncbi:hypothetical protein [Okeania sp.]|uniref:hypothetical protein n=1 Tax=Okeania sp. TaxID=3100323 RepID=UPI002B4AE185|nr:hypothetical protein [Okeania sp.]MEB3339936.1 hypothetical protein [Okeania sp.]